MNRYAFQVSGDGTISGGLVETRGRTKEVACLASIRTDEEANSWVGESRAEARDLTRIALAVHHVDRLARRGGGTARDFAWQREIALDVHVSDPHRWKALGGQLEKLLAWMTTDRWYLAFTGLTTRVPKQTALFADRDPDANEVALFSGGLDSVAGLYCRFNEKKRTSYVFSAYGTSVREAFIKKALETLDELKVPSRWVRFAHSRPSTGDLDEPTQRARGFLFLAAAAALAHELGEDRVVTFEPGVGAINLPISAAQIGSFNTRAMPPILSLSSK